MGKEFLQILLLFVLTFSLPNTNVCAQALTEHQQDSLWQYLRNPAEDTTVLSASAKLIEHYYYQGDTIGFNEVLPYCEDKLKLINPNAASILNYQGYYLFRYNRNTIAGRDKIHEAIAINEKLGLDDEVAGSYLSLGILFKRNAIYNEAIDNYFKAIDLYEKTGNLPGLGNAYNNIANIFAQIKKYDKAIEYHHKSLYYRQKDQNQSAINISYFGLGLAYYDLEMHDSAEYYYKLTIEKADEIGQTSISAKATSSLGILYADNHEFEKALPYYKKALELRESLGDQSGVSFSKLNLGMLYLNNRFDPVIDDYCMDAYHYSVESNDIVLQQISCECLYRYYKEINDYKSAYNFLKEYLVLHDSIINIEDQADLISREVSYAYEKKAAADSVAFAKQQEIDQTKIALQEADIRAKKNLQYGMIVGILLLMVFAVFMYNRFKITQSQKRIIEDQKQNVEEQRELLEARNKEVTDSITYARRIQEAILPSRDTLRQNLNDGFVLYKPKDIVAGDFYWMERVEDTIYFAVADCTGHGVPGAMISVVCSTALSKALLEEKITDPGKLLDRTRKLVVERLAKNGDIVNDGMDISLCSMKQSPRDNATILNWAGANSPLWIYRSGQDIMETFKADKQPVGNHPDPKPFTTHTIPIEKGDILYLFSDGFQDQFGGENPFEGVVNFKPGGKKLKAANFKKMLLQIHAKPMDEQAKILEDLFENWRGSFEQIDDVCVIGVRI